MDNLSEYYLSPKIQAAFTVFLMFVFFLSISFGNWAKGNIPHHIMYTPILLHANIITISCALNKNKLSGYLIRALSIWILLNILTLLSLYLIDKTLFLPRQEIEMNNFLFLVTINLYLFMALLLATFFRFLTQILEEK